MGLDKINTFVVGAIIVLCALIPPIDFTIAPPFEYWPWLILIASFFGMFLWFLEVPLLPKAISTFTFVDCFFSSAPYISFGAYVTVVMGCYFYCLCYRIKDAGWIFKALQTVVVLNLVLFAVQYFHHDDLLNFGIKNNNCFGSVGQHMQAGSFMTVMSAILLPFNIFNLVVPFIAAWLTHSVWTFFSASLGALIIMRFAGMDKRILMSCMAGFLIAFLFLGFHSGKFNQNLNQENGRSTVWGETIRLANQRPWTGWGPGTYKIAFYPLAQVHKSIVSNPWEQAHNFWIQMVFEIGYPATAIIVIFQFIIIYILAFDVKRAPWQNQSMVLLAACVMVLSDFMVHFPERMLQSVPMMIFFSAYVMKFIRKGEFYVSPVTS